AAWAWGDDRSVIRLGEVPPSRHVGASMAKLLTKPKHTALKPAEKARIAELFARFEAAESDPRTELNYASPFELVVAVALSAQATDISVNKATAKLFAAADTPQKMFDLGE